MHFDDRDAAKQVAGNLTLRGNHRQLTDLPCGHCRWKALKIRLFSGKNRIGTTNACGNMNKKLNTFDIEGLDVRRVISCH